MINDHKTVRDFLLTNGPLVALVDTRIYPDMETPPAGYEPTDGPCICFKRRGGSQDYEAVNLFPSYQFKCYGEIGGTQSPEASAEEVYRALFEALNYQSTYLIKSVEMEAQGQPLLEPDTGWKYTLCFYRLQVLN
jgi:hypothetical protein